MAIGQHLSEVDIVVGPDGCIGHGGCSTHCHYPHALIVGLRYRTTGIDEVTVGITTFYIAHIAILSIRLSRIVARERILR